MKILEIHANVKGRMPLRITLVTRKHSSVPSGTTGFIILKIEKGKFLDADISKRDALSKFRTKNLPDHDKETVSLFFMHHDKGLHVHTTTMAQ